MLIGLAGPSGSGKTVFSEKIRSFIPGVAVISMDMYNDGSKVVRAARRGVDSCGPVSSGDGPRSQPPGSARSARRR